MRTFDPTIEQNILRIVQEEVVPALGCTEPISLALASATACHYLGKLPERIEAKVSSKFNEKWNGRYRAKYGHSWAPNGSSNRRNWRRSSGRFIGIKSDLNRTSCTCKSDAQSKSGYRHYF